MASRHKGWLLDYLSDRQVGVVATRFLPDPEPQTVDRYKLIDRWLSEHPEDFVGVQRGPWFSVFRLQRDATRGSRRAARSAAAVE